MVAIEPIIKEIRRKLHTDDVRLPTAAEIRSSAVPSKALGAGLPDVLGKDDRTPNLAGRRTTTSGESSKAPWQAHKISSK